MGFTQGTHRNTRRAVWLAVAGLILSLLLVAAVSPSPAEAIQYFGKKPGKWEAEIEIRNGFIRSMHLKLPSNCRDQKRPPGLNLEINRDSKLRLRRYGGFYRESVTRWSKSVLKGPGDRQQGPGIPLVCGLRRLRPMLDRNRGEALLGQVRRPPSPRSSSAGARSLRSGTNRKGESGHIALTFAFSPPQQPGGGRPTPGAVQRVARRFSGWRG